ncbi:TetR/AcrR family transcriptional regulator [Labedella endophytica]|uniref:TetR/AcrR family transcriptional regulator n=1 Tax=Labedella endophytica TaxID=1523160 RepID=A0A3S0XBY5_9MICO|nr:TetR/AcrR family transcriptional regulator [Labedella endophytica]RUR01828.1 TetR/AcrR family transcriptional regulator [Labedella endophytica]
MTSEASDPRVARTRRDVVDATAALLVERGWDGVTHAEVARHAGYSKATVYTHWPTRLDLISAAIEQICDVEHHPPATGDLRADLRTSLLDFATDLSDGHLDRLLAGVVERADTSEVVRALRTRLYETGTAGLRSILGAHLDAVDVEPSLALLTGALLVRVTFEGVPATEAFVDDLVTRVLSAVEARRSVA